MSVAGENALGVVLSKHALERLGERWPEVPLHELAHRVRMEVANAYAHGRVARHLPRSLAQRGRRPAISRWAGRRRFAWSARGDLAVVVRRLPGRDRRGRRQVLVVTVFEPRVDDLSIEASA